MFLSSDVIATLLDESRTIAVVGLSSNPRRPSYEVAQYLQAHGYRIVPVNPTYAGETILNEPCYRSLTEAAQAVAQRGVQIDIVDCFRKSETIPPIAQEAVAIGARCLWLQLGVYHAEAANFARAAGLAVVMERCLKIEHMQR